MIDKALSNTPHKLSEDVYLKPFWDKIKARKAAASAKEKLITGNQPLVDFANAHKYFGLHFVKGGWTFREWAPNATAVYFTGDFCSWRKLDEYRLKALGGGAWEINLPGDLLKHQMHYGLFIEWPGGGGIRVPAYAKYVVQDPKTKLFSAMVWHPETPYRFRHLSPKLKTAPLIYETHVGMAQEEAKIGSFNEYREKILPMISGSGYNTIQFMAIMGHPYYGSFGYHVANFYSIASRFGTPEEFKQLVDAAHGMGLKVIIDLVHSHAVKNEDEGLARFDGTRYAYFHAGARGEHRAWDSLCFNYDKPEVLHFLLSNCKYYLEEYHIDGFRFDGVTSMLYSHHGLNKVFTSYQDYFGDDIDEQAVIYLTLANRLIHQYHPEAITVAEDVSGMPGLAAPTADGGIGFDYRLAMGVTDMWFKVFDMPDELWSMNYIYHELTNRREDEKTISYVECHDQAIVGGQTAIFRLAGSAMYDSMSVFADSMAIDRAIALHKMIRLATIATAGNGYLNFMGNEFGHPEWIDFPREGNNWSMWYARRQWSLVMDKNLRYRHLANFDRAMINCVESHEKFYMRKIQKIHIDENNMIMIFERDGLFFCFNFHPTNSVSDYEFEVPGGKFELVLDSDAAVFGGFKRLASDQQYFALQRPSGMHLSIYLPCRTALVLQKIN